MYAEDPSWSGECRKVSEAEWEERGLGLQIARVLISALPLSCRTTDTVLKRSGSLRLFHLGHNNGIYLSGLL